MANEMAEPTGLAVLVRRAGTRRRQPGRSRPALIAQRIAVDPGRDENERAARLYVGLVEMTFLMTDSRQQGTGQLAKRVTVH
jgi:hypothetical protein